MANAAKQNLKVDVLWPRRTPHQAERREGCRRAICGERLRSECLWFDYGYWSGSFTHELNPPNSDYRWVRDPRKCGRHIRVCDLSGFLTTFDGRGPKDGTDNFDSPAAVRRSSVQAPRLA